MIYQNRVHWVFILRARVDCVIDGRSFSSGDILSMWQAPSHPCFGNGGEPGLVPHPFPDFDESTMEIICINPTDEEVQQIRAKAIMGKGVQNKDFLEVVDEDYEIDDTVQPSYPDMKITVGLSDDWQSLPMGSKVIPVKERIYQPAMVRTAVLKKKAKQIGGME